MESRLPQVRVLTAKPDTVSWRVNAFSGRLFSTLLFLYRYPIIHKYTFINAKNRHGASKSDHVGDYHTGAHGDPRQL